jgi:hypothetical protein
MGALEMFQQISRARKTSVVNLLVLDPNAIYSYNQYISYEQNKSLQESYINGYSKFQDDLCKKYDIINEMGSTMVDIDGKIKFNNGSFMTEIHYLKTWYDQLFYKNKVDIIKLIAKEYGYKIIDHKWDPEIKLGCSLKSKLKLKKEEIIEISKQIHLGGIIDPKYKYYIDNLKEQIKMREKYLHNILDADKYIELISDHDKFINYLNKKYLDLSKDEFNKKIIEINNNDILQIVKEDDLINKINTCFWLEETIKFNRYDINNIKCDNIDNIKSIFNKNIDKFYYIYKNNASKERIIKLLKNKIISINNLNLLQKFIADCYNAIVEDCIIIKNKTKKNKGNIISTYIFL